MKVLLGMLSLLALSASQGTNTACVKCLHSTWFRAVALNKGTNRCSVISLEQVFQCLDICDATPAHKPLSYRIRQLTQISDIFHSLLTNNCSVESVESIGGGCESMINCVLSVSNYQYEGRTTHSPFSTVFDYKCGQTVNRCTSVDRLNKLSYMLSLGVEAACDEPRRCVKYGNIFEVKPGTNCNEYYQEAAAYGPSLDRSKPTQIGQGFNPETCNIDIRGNITCPADPIEMPIYSEVPPTTPALEVVPIEYEPIRVNTNLPCEECLYPVWYRAVTTNGSHLCEPSFQSLVYECLANCKCCPGCLPCHERYEQLKTEVLVKLADISKALDLNQCTGNPSCSAASYQCTENLARFYPMSAPHVTVNTLSCRPEDLANTISCFNRACSDSAVANALTNIVIDGFDPICNSNNIRCLSYGNIYEYVPAWEVNATAAVIPCAHYRQAPVNGWYKPTAINRVRDIHLFNTRGCYPDWPENVACPPEIMALDPML